MIKTTDLASIQLLAERMKDGLRPKSGSALQRVIITDIAPTKPGSIEEVLSFTQGSAQSERLIEEVSKDITVAVSTLMGKVQNELLVFIDDIYDDVKHATNGLGDELVTHKLNIVPEIDFIDSMIASEIADIDTTSLVRNAYPQGSREKFPERTLNEVMECMSKSMTKDSLESFGKMIFNLDIDVLSIYNKVIRGIDNNIPPQKPITFANIPYRFIEAVVGYHLAVSLLDTPDEDVRLTEVQYVEVVTLQRNNMLVRYSAAIDGIQKILSADNGLISYVFKDEIFELNLYQPFLDKNSKDQLSRTMLIERLLNICARDAFGHQQNINDTDVYKAYRKRKIGEGSLFISATKVRAIQVAIEDYVGSKSFQTWYSSNYEGTADDNVRITFLKEMRAMCADVSIGSDSDVYRQIIRIVCDVFYKRPQFKAFLTDINTIVTETEVTVHEALGVAADHLIISFLVDMVDDSRA